MAQVRVYELAKEFGVSSKVVLAALGDLGEFVRSASSTLDAPVVSKLRRAFTTSIDDADFELTWPRDLFAREAQVVLA